MFSEVDRRSIVDCLHVARVRVWVHGQVARGYIISYVGDCSTRTIDLLFSGGDPQDPLDLERLQSFSYILNLGFARIFGVHRKNRTTKIRQASTNKRKLYGLSYQHLV